MATQSEVAAHLDLSQQAVSQMVRAGTLPAADAHRGLDVAACRVAYVRHLREQAAGRAPIGDGPADLDLVAERARLAKEQADAQAMKNDITRGHVVDVHEVARQVGASYAIVRNRFLALPSAHAARLVRIKTPQEMQDTLYGLIVSMLEELTAPEASSGAHIEQPG